MDAALPISQVSTQTSGKRFGIRAGAYMLDTIILNLVSYAVAFAAALPIGFVIGVANGFYGQTYVFDEEPDKIVNFLGNLVMLTLYFTLFEWLYGATPGKLVFGLRVVKEDGGGCSLGSAFVRALLRFVDGLFCGLVAYAKMKAPQYQRLGDQAARTIVVGSGDPIFNGRAGFGGSCSPPDAF